MKKLITKIAGITAGIAMAVGVGAGIVLNNNQKASQVNATTADSTPSTSIVSGKSYLVTAVYNATRYYLTPSDKALSTGNVLATSVTNIATATSSMCWTFTASSTSWTISANGFYLANTNDNNGVKTQAGSQTWSASFDGSNLTLTGGNSRKLSLYQGTNWRCYTTSSGVQNLQIYEFDPDAPLPSTYSVTYHPNGGTGTTTDNNSYDPNDEVTVLANGFTRSGYTFDCWNTAANGSGESYDPTDTFEITENITLYAQWTLIKYLPTDEDNQLTWNLAVASYETMESSSASWVSSKASISVAKNTSSTATNNYCPPARAVTRFYKDSVMTISPESGYKIDSIVFTAETADNATTLKNNSWTNASTSVDSSTVIVTPTIKPNDVTVTFSAAIGVTQIVINYSSYTPLDSIAISGTYSTEFIQGDVFSHEGMVVTATYDDDSDADVTASATWSGYNMANTGSQTVTVSYTEEGVTRTTTYSISVSAPLTPFVVPETDSVEGFSGQSHILSFDYGNLAGALSAVSNDEGVAEVTSFSYDAGEGTVTLGFVAAGSTTIEFFDGASTLGVTVSVSVTTSTVTITGLAARDSVQLASNLDLGSTISVVATGSCSSDLTWTSSNGDIATVDEDGVVTGVAQGTVNITVKADDYPSATMTCAVTVAHKKTIDFTTGYNVAKPASAQEDLSSVEINDYELNILNCHNLATDYEYMMFATSQLKTSNSLISNRTPTPGEISKIVFKIKAGSAGGAVYKATLSDSEVTSKVTSSTYSRTGAGDLIITADPNDDLRYFGISCSTSSANGQIESIDIYYREPSAKEVISEIDTLSSLSYSDYTKVSEDNYTFTDLLIRYGGFISQGLWERLDDELDIQGYGVILSTGNEEIEDLYAAAKDEGDTVIEALAEFVDGTNIKRFYTALSLSKTHPTEASTEQKTYMGVDTGDTYYIWTLGKGISSEHMTTVYNVVAYIIVDGDIVFLNAAKESAKTLAADLIDNDIYEESDFGGSLKYLADLSVLP